MVGVMESKSGGCARARTISDHIKFLARARKRTPRTRTLLGYFQASCARRVQIAVSGLCAEANKGQLGPHSGL